MKKWIWVLFIVMISSVLVVAEEQVPLSEAERRFVEDFIVTVNTNDMDKFKNLHHPHYLSCMDDSNRDYFENRFSSKLKIYTRFSPIPAAYEITFQLLKAEEARAQIETARNLGLEFPDLTYGKMDLVYMQDEYAKRSIQTNIIYEEERVFLLIGCPSPEVAQKFRPKE